MKQSILKYRKTEIFKKIKEDIKISQANPYNDETTALAMTRSVSNAVSSNAIYQITRRELRSLRLKRMKEKTEEDGNLPQILDLQILDELGNDEINVSNLKKYFTDKTSLKVDIGSNNLVLYVEELEKINKELKSNLAEMKQDELSRICREYLINDYERVFRVNIDTIFSSIVGEQNVVTELKKFLEEKRNYYKSLELCRNFSVFQSKYEKVYTSLFNKNKDDTKN